MVVVYLAVSMVVFYFKTTSLTRKPTHACVRACVHRNKTYVQTKTQQVDLSSKKAFLKETVTSILAEGQEEEDGGEEEEEEEEEVVKPVKPKRADFQVSPALFEFLGGKEEFKARGDVRDPPPLPSPSLL